MSGPEMLYETFPRKGMKGMLRGNSVLLSHLVAGSIKDYVTVN